jgi:hypothetical protein
MKALLLQTMTLSLVLMLMDCNFKQQQLGRFDSSSLTNASYIKVSQDAQISFIDDSIKVDSILRKINGAKAEIVKWGSFDYMEFYTSDSTMILHMIFGANRIKIDGFVYKINSNW